MPLLLWPSQLAAIAEIQLESRSWYASAVTALWQYEAIGFHGYLSQWIRWKGYSAESAAGARLLMGITDDDQTTFS
jgi:hypothetical protein